MTHNSRRALWIATGFGTLWLLLALAAADFPPPRGFIWVVAADVVLSLVVYWRARVYAGWARQRRAHRVARSALEGLAAGLVVALLFGLAGGGEPSVTTSGRDLAVWCAVVGALGALDGLIVYGLAAGATASD